MRVIGTVFENQNNATNNFQEGSFFKIQSHQYDQESYKKKVWSVKINKIKSKMFQKKKQQINTKAFRKTTTTKNNNSKKRKKKYIYIYKRLKIEKTKGTEE